MIPDWIRTPRPEIYESPNYIVLDFETTNKRFGTALDGDNRIVLSVFGQGSRYKGILGTELDQGELVEAVRMADFIVAHNAKFECGWLKRCGVDLRNLLVYDTMIGEYVLYGNNKPRLNLGDTAKRYGLPGKEAFVDQCIKGGVCPSDIPTSLLKERCVYDVRTTEYIFRQQRERLKRQGKLGVHFTRCLATPCLADIEFNGLYLDKERVDAEHDRVSRELADINREFAELSGGINPRSPKQLAAFLYDDLGFAEGRDPRGNPVRTPTGGRRCDLSTISALTPRTREQQRVRELILRQSKLDAALTKNLEFFKAICDEKESLFQGQFNQTTTRTHRLSSSGLPISIGGRGRPRGVQFQNLPRGYKSLFTAREEGWRVVEVDGAQLEFRVAAHLGRDAVARGDIGSDVHSRTAEIIGCSRQEAKAHTFKPLFGGMSGTKAERKYYQWFRDRYQGITQAQERWKSEVLKTKELVTETGLVFYWPDVSVDRTGYIKHSTSICNYPVQSLATADIIPVSLTYLWHKIRDMDSFITNTVHDSVIAEVKQEEEEEFREAAVWAFTEVPYLYLQKVYNIEFTAPLGCGYKAGTHWGEAEEVSYETNRRFD